MAEVADLSDTHELIEYKLKMTERMAGAKRSERAAVKLIYLRDEDCRQGRSYHRIVHKAHDSIFKAPQDCDCPSVGSFLDNVCASHISK